MADLTDKMIGGFRILAEIKGASGSQGQIFKAVCEVPPFAGIETGTVVALKAMAVHDEDGRAWAKLEKRTSELVRLSHPNVVKYYGCFSESGTFNDIHAIVQEFLEGETLKQRLARCPSGLDADEALHVTEAALAGLEYTAASGIVHRDVKPGNIFLCSDGCVKLIDFEIAHQEGGTTTSASGNLVGSFDYMAPDFTNSMFRGDERSDVFSMGVVMHEAITGRTPYQRIEGGGGQANFAFLTRWARLNVDGTNPIRISSRANRLLAHSEEVLEKALAPLPQERYESFSAFRAGLKAIRYRDLRNGDKVYRILQIIGKGGFGEVFKARLKGSNQLVAIKHLLKAAYAERFYREAKIMARLHDPCFVRFIDFFVVNHAGNQEAFLVMDFLSGMPGSSLRDAIKRAGGSGLPQSETLQAFARFAHGLSVLHARGIFHRDIKPSNLYYPDEHPERAAIMDLGIARDVHGSITTGQVPGTLDYMPPEVVLSGNRGESGMDIYALGLCLYEALSGKTAYPRLPQGTAAYTAFFTRAKIKAMPDLSAPSIVENAPLHDLLKRMTHPDLSERLVDTPEVERRLLELAEAAGGGTIDLPAVQPEPDDDGAGETQPGTATIPSLVETRPDMPGGAEPGTHGTFATRGTLATAATDVANRDALERERRRIDEERRGDRRKMLLRWLMLVGVMVVACGTVWAFWGRIVEWRHSRAASLARPAAEYVAKVYAEGGLDAGRQAEKDWLARWAPGSGGWFELDEGSFADCTNRIRAGEVALYDLAAERAADELAVYYLDTKKTAADCKVKFEEWCKEWKPRCSAEKFASLEGRTRKSAQYGTYRRAGIQLAERYRVVTNTLESCEIRAERWRKTRPDGFPDDEFNKLNAHVVKAREERVKIEGERAEEQVREENKSAAESELAGVVKAYEAGTAAGDAKAEQWRKNWESKLALGVFSEMDVQIATARAERVEIERQERIKAKKKAFVEDCRQVIAGYRDDSLGMAKTDAKYDELKKRKSDSDLQDDWLAPRVAEVEKAREERLAKERKSANDELQAVIRTYDDGTQDISAGDKRAKEWREKWNGKLDADSFSQMSAEIGDAHGKRDNFEKWKEEQQILATKTNEVEAVRATLVKGYKSDSEKDKSNLDSQFDAWARQWEADEVLQKSLPNWFAGRKRTVEDAKSAYEARIAEAERKRHVADKTKEAEAVRKQLEDGYRIDTSDKPQLDREFRMWMLKWSADSDLPPGWFAEQREAVEKVKVAREARDAAVREAELVCDFYRTAGVEVGNVRREKWKAAWTNKLDVATFQKLSKRIDADREGRVKRDKDESLEKKMVEVESACTNLVENYITDTIPKADTDKLYNQKLKEWEDDEVLKGVWSWFSEQKRKVDVAQSAREQRDKEKRAREERDAARRDAELVCDMYRNAGMAAGDVLRKKWDDDWTNKLESATLSELLQRIEKVRKDVMPPPEPPKPVVDYALVEKTNRVGTVCTGLVKDYADVAVPKANTDNRYAQTLEEWDADGDLKKDPFKDWLAEQKRQVEDAKRVREQRIAAKKKEIAESSKQLADAYKSDKTEKKKVDQDFDSWIEKWRRDVDLSSGLFAELRGSVDEAKGEREVRDTAKQESQLVCDLYQTAGMAAGDVLRKRWIDTWTNKLDVATFRGLSQRIEKVRKDVMPPPEPPKPVVDYALVTKTNRVEAVCAGLVKDYEDAAIPKTNTDIRYERTLADWNADQDLNAESLKNWLAEQKRKVEDAKGARAKRDKERYDSDQQRIAAKTNEVMTVRMQLENAYKSDMTGKNKLDKDFDAWVGKWSRDSDLPLGWFDEQRKWVDTAKRDREVRDEGVRLRQEAGDAAKEICETYRNDGVQTGDVSRKWWDRTWTNRLDSATFRKLSLTIDDARAARIRLDKEREERERQRVAEKKDKLLARRKQLEAAYQSDRSGNDPVEKDKVDKDFEECKLQWDNDKDLPRDWLTEQIGVIDTEKRAREARDAARDTAEKNRKDAYDDAVRVCKGYVAGIESGEAERQLWDGKWKPILDEATYGKISAVIDKARDKASAKAKQARMKAEGERLEKEIKALLEVDQNQVERWKGQLADAERKIVEGKALLGQEKVDDLKGEVARRKKWVIGVVANRTDHVIRVGGRSINPGQREYFELPEGMPQGGWQVSSAGYKPLTIDQSALDCSVVSVGDGKWKLEPIPKARVHVPVLGAGVTCLVDDKVREGGSEFELASGTHRYVYKLANHVDQEGKFVVQGGVATTLAQPGKWAIDPAIKDKFKKAIEKAEQCLEVNDGEFCLRIYHEIGKEGYRLAEDDKGNVETAYEMCKEDYKIKLARAKRDPRFKEEDVQRWWEGILDLYYDLTGKR